MLNHYVLLKQGSDSNPGLHPPLRLKVFCILSAIVNLALLWCLVAHSGINGTLEDQPYIYSPAEHIVSHRFVKFTRGLADDIPIYERRPSPAVDEAWSALYSVAQTKVSRSEALKMANRTWPLLGQKGSYVFALDVFHQLHCLDTLRKQLSPGHNYTRVSGSHIRHCIGAIRQALMCSADTSTIVWQWSDELEIAEQRDDIIHVCRDFDRIRDWASERTFEDTESDFGVYVENDLPVFWPKFG